MYAYHKGIWNGPWYWDISSLLPGYCGYIPTTTLSKPLIGTSSYTSSFTPKGANRHGQDTLPLHGENLSLQWIEQIDKLAKKLHFHSFQWRGGEKQPEAKNSKRPWIQLVDQSCLHWGKWQGSTILRTLYMLIRLVILSHSWMVKFPLMWTCSMV